MPANWIRRQRCSHRMALAAAGMLLVASSCATAPQFAQNAHSLGGNGAVNAHDTVDTRDGSARRGTTPISPLPPRVVQLKREEAHPITSVQPERPVESAPVADETTPVVEAFAVAPSAVDAAEASPSAEPQQLQQPQVETAVAAGASRAAPSILPTDHSAAPISHQRSVYFETAVDAREFLPADPRIELATVSSAAGPCPQPYSLACEVPVPIYEPEVYPEEYICDGGDRGDRVHYTHIGRQGLDTEDTVAEFTDDTGCVHIRPSTRTCIYAPQFAAVRSMSLQQVNLSVDKLAGTHDHRPSVGFRSQLRTGVEEKTDQPIGINTRSRPSGLDSDITGGSVARVQTTARHIKLNNVFENELFLAPGGLDRTQEAYLAHAIQIAASWTRDLNPVIVATDVGGQEVIAKFRIEEYVGVEDRRTKGDLKIIKVVDEPTAVPGDTVTFTIHYENIGDRSLSHVRIIDNLTPRLELLPDTAQSDREGRFSVEDNQEGSVVLTFELADTLPGKTGGTVTFQCRVR